MSLDVTFALYSGADNRDRKFGHTECNGARPEVPSLVWRVWSLSQDANSETVEKEVSECVRDLELCVYFSPAYLSLLGSIRRGLLSWLQHPDL